ncbi:MAG: 3-phosphoshikimate 1-carboxyvinyltransferase [Balneolales bacterium]|nr:3-phosphoshikimate 1-carboxyvinyltransferase [Balneolales bacterium]
MIKKVAPVFSLNGTITPPPDKSISQRAAIFALMHDGISVIKNYSPAEDPQSTLGCVQLLGAEVSQLDGVVTIEGCGRYGVRALSDELDCGNSGTAMRLLSGVLVGAGTAVYLIGDPSLSSRTMKRIIDPLEQMGAHILARNGEFAPMFVTREDPLVPIEYMLPIASAQLKSCILLAGLFGETPTKVIENVPSRDHTERLLNLNVEEENGVRVISASLKDEIPNQSYTIPADFSAAAFWLVAGCIMSDSEIRMKNVGLNPTRTGLLNILVQMGADITIENEGMVGAEPVGDIIVRSSRLYKIDIKKEFIPNCIDELPIISVAMLFAEGISVISGAEELRHKETDRIKAITRILEAVGANFEEMEDGLVIHGDPDFKFNSANFQSFHDHRIAMASAILSLKGNSESEIEDAESAAVSYKSFWEDLEVLSK